LTFNKRRILLSGASRGIGLGAVRLLLAEGASVIGTGQDAARLEASAQELKKLGDFHGVAADLGRPAQAASILAEAVKQRWGALDVLVNNAAIGGQAGGYAKIPADDLEKVLQVNLLAPHHLIKALLPFLEKGSEPRVLNVSSESGQLRNQQRRQDDPSYNLSKYALNSLSMLWSAELHGRVAVNAMHPGWVRSDMGGPEAPDDLATGGRRIVQALAKPFTETGKFWYGEEAIDW
jgi:NAD(P)-dependent dehydrogenase (short-subunit alcohol dehydrogenase family)